MGQIVVGVMLGCKAPKGMGLWTDEPSGGLLERWEKVSGEQYPKKYRIGVSDPDCNTTVFGYWVRCDDGGELGVDGFDDCVRVALLGKGKAYAKASAAWKKFAAWAKREGIKLPAPELWIVPTEVA